MYKHVLHFAVVVLVLMCSVRALASDIEEVIVIGANVAQGYSNPETDSSLIEALDPTRIYQPGGLGGFVGATTNGTDTGVVQFPVINQSMPNVVDEDEGALGAVGDALPGFGLMAGMAALAMAAVASSRVKKEE